MKKQLLLLLIAPVLGFGQIGKINDNQLPETTLIGEVTNPVGFIASLKKSVIDGDNFYMLSFRNFEYQYLVDAEVLSFNATNDEIEYLFLELKKGFKSKSPVTLDIGKSKIMFKQYISNKNLIITVSGDANGFFSLTGKQLHTLFNKPFNKKEFKEFLKQ